MGRWNGDSYKWSNLEPKWNIEITGFNTCPCLREDSFLYFTGSGFIGKIDLETGKYVWSHKLDNSANSFKLPILSEDKITFTEDIEGSNQSNPKVIVMNKFAGNILNQ